MPPNNTRFNWGYRQNQSIGGTDNPHPGQPGHRMPMDPQLTAQHMKSGGQRAAPLSRKRLAAGGAAKSKPKKGSC